MKVIEFKGKAAHGAAHVYLRRKNRAILLIEDKYILCGI